jgi:hypothetical protein
MRAKPYNLRCSIPKRKDSRYRSGRSPDWIKSKNPNAPGGRREVEETGKYNRRGHNYAETNLAMGPSRMAFLEALKLEVKRKAAFRCCRCHEIGIDIHHIIPEAQGGPDDINLCYSRNLSSVIGRSRTRFPVAW